MITRHEFRFDEFGLQGNCSGSTVIVGGSYDEQMSIHWGNASRSGKTSPIVTVQVGFVSVTFDEDVIGRDKLQALHDARYDYGKRKKNPKPEVDTPPANRFDAATAAIAAKHYHMAMEIDPSALTDLVMLEALTALVNRISPAQLMALVKAGFQAADELRRDSEEQGADKLRAALRGLLGVGRSRVVCACSRGGEP